MDTATYRRSFLLGLGMPESAIPNPIDTASFRRLVLQNIGGAGGGGSGTQSVAPPATASDLSMFPGGVVPAGQQYIALDKLNVYTIKSGESTWSITPR